LCLWGSDEYGTPQLFFSAQVECLSVGLLYLPACPDLLSLEVTSCLRLGSFSVTDWQIRESEP